MASKLPGYLFDLVVSCPTTLEAQVTLVVMQATFWATMIPVIARKSGEWIKTKPWCDQWTTLNIDTFKKAYSIEFKTTEEAFDFACLLIGILTQHAVGGFLAAIAVFAPTSSGAARIFAGHAALCEVGWELQDVITRAYQIIFGGEAGKAKNPLPWIMMLAIHHAMGLGIAVPMNMSQFNTEPAFHEMVFLLQLAAAVAMGAQQYSYTLNVRSAEGLKSMKASVTLVFVTVLWSRIIRFMVLGYQLFMIFYNSGAMAFVYGGVTVVGLMSVINILLFMDSVGKFVKFIKMRPVIDDDVAAARKPLPPRRSVCSSAEQGLSRHYTHLDPR